MGKTNGAFALGDLAEAVTALAPWLEPGDATRQATAAVRLVGEAMAKTNDGFALHSLAFAVGALAPQLEPGDATRQASAAARRTVDAIGKTNDPNALRFLAEAVGILIVRIGPEETSQRTGSLAFAVGNACNPPTLFAGLAPLVEASQPPSGRVTDQQLVDLLKMPTCRQPARQVIVRQLGWQCGHTFANEWEFVEWARANRPKLDLTSPPAPRTHEADIPPHFPGLPFGTFPLCRRAVWRPIYPLTSLALPLGVVTVTIYREPMRPIYLLTPPSSP